MRNVDLVWSNAVGTDVEVHRRRNKEVTVFTTANDGAFLDSFGGGGTYGYKVCEIGGTICSAEQDVAF